MAENPTKQEEIRKKRTETAAVIAELSGYSSRHVRLVMNGRAENDDILNATILYEQEKNKLIQKIKELIPFN